MSNTTITTDTPAAPPAHHTSALVWLKSPEARRATSTSAPPTPYAATSSPHTSAA